jgi:probable F420-dependent oxidoreductase
MRIAINTFFEGRQPEPFTDFIAGVSQAFEERGIAGVWLGEHVVTFPKYVADAGYPYNDTGEAPDVLPGVGFIDPMSTLAAMAVHSKTLRLGTGVAILPQRNPLYFAKEGAAIDLMSNGRFIAGVGIGWSAQEYAATGTPFEHRGSRMRDYIQVVRSLWVDKISQFQGEFYTLPPCIHLPKPVQRPHPPFYFGGESEPAMRRVAEFGQGWFAFWITPEELAPKIARLKEMLARHGRSIADIDLVAGPPADKPIDERMLADFAALGVSEVVAVCFGNSVDDYRRESDRIVEQFVKPASRL